MIHTTRDEEFVFKGQEIPDSKSDIEDICGKEARNKIPMPPDGVDLEGYVRQRLEFPRGVPIPDISLILYSSATPKSTYRVNVSRVHYSVENGSVRTLMFVRDVARRGDV